MKERKHGSTVAVASAKAGMSRQTGSKYLGTDKLPSELKRERCQGSGNVIARSSGKVIPLGVPENLSSSGWF